MKKGLASSYFRRIKIVNGRRFFVLSVPKVVDRHIFSLFGLARSKNPFVSSKNPLFAFEEIAPCHSRFFRSIFGTIFAAEKMKGFTILGAKNED